MFASDVWNPEYVHKEISNGIPANRHPRFIDGNVNHNAKEHVQCHTTKGNIAEFDAVAIVLHVSLSR